MTDAVSPPPPPPSLLALPTYVLSRLGRASQRLAQDAIADLGLLPPHFAVLATLDDTGPLAQHELADRLGIHRSHLVGYVDELEKRAAVRRRRDPEDRRRQTVSLTPAGQTLLAQLQAPLARAQAQILAPLSEPERTVLMELVARLLPEAEATEPPGSAPGAGDDRS